jgi:hypothetical protein
MQTWMRQDEFGSNPEGLAIETTEVENRLLLRGVQ